MRVLLPETVRDAAKRRISWLFDEFDNVVVNHSGGKDSTVIWNLALEVAREKDRLPLRTFFLDSEAEWQSTVDHMRDDVMYRDDVEPFWMQVPLTMFLGASGHEWFTAWHPDYKKSWVHEKQPIAVTEGYWPNPLRFMDMFTSWAQNEYEGERVVKIVGLRGEESPGRLFGLTSAATYGGETWGMVEDRRRGHYVMNPIYDWAFNDVWHAIAEGNWPYNRLYDIYWRLNVPRNAMRVADLTSGDMSRTSLVLAEIEPETYAKLQKRLGPEAIERMEMRGWFPERLPPMFGSWIEYRDYLLENLITRDDWREAMQKKFASSLERFDTSLHEALLRVHIGAVLINDWRGVQVANFEAAHPTERSKGAA